MAISTATTTLMYTTDTLTPFDTPAPVKLVDITSYPDMGGTPSKLDTTTLSATKFKTSILGLQEVPDLVFECNYDKTDYTTINDLADTLLHFQLQFGDDGEDGKFDWNGKVSIYASGGGVDEVRKMQITVSAETEIVAS